MAERKKPNKRMDRAQLLGILRNRIIEGEYPPGSKLIEKTLLGEFGISRQMARELLQELESRGLVQKEPNKGATVRRMDLNTLFEIMDLREVIEGLAARLATQNSHAGDWQDLVEAFGERMDQMIREKDFEGYLTLVNKFQDRMLKLAGNAELSLVADRIYAKMLIIQRRLICLPGRLQAGIKEHRDVIQAIVSGDAEKAETLKRNNIRSAINTLKRYQKMII
jgi:DNA-binding GntR family transcriptional regulator